jgi:hypothetical protein
MVHRPQTETSSSVRDFLFSRDTAVQFGLFLAMLVVFAPLITEAFTAVTFGILEPPAWLGAGAGVVASVIGAIWIRLSQE